MKFEKFVKSLASTGVVYEHSNGDRYLASPSVFMRIPDNIKSVTALDVKPMPDAVANMIDSIGMSEECSLYSAIMPKADGGIKDCIRVYKAAFSKMTLPISDPDYKLLEKTDWIEILFRSVGSDEEGDRSIEPVALVVKTQQTRLADSDVVGLIFPVTDEGVQF